MARCARLQAFSSIIGLIRLYMRKVEDISITCERLISLRPESQQGYHSGSLYVRM